jgi:hypothetical protein
MRFFGNGSHGRATAAGRASSDRMDGLGRPTRRGAIVPVDLDPRRPGGATMLGSRVSLPIESESRVVALSAGSDTPTPTEQVSSGLRCGRGSSTSQHRRRMAVARRFHRLQRVGPKIDGPRKRPPRPFERQDTLCSAGIHQKEGPDAGDSAWRRCHVRTTSPVVASTWRTVPDPWSVIHRYPLPGSTDPRSTNVRVRSIRLVAGSSRSSRPRF